MIHIWQGHSVHVILAALWIHGEPAFLDPFVLGKYLSDAPKAGEGNDSQDDAQRIICAEEAACAEQYAGQQECPPAFAPEVVFCFDDEGMEHADGEERSHADDDACHVHEMRCL